MRRLLFATVLVTALITLSACAPAAATEPSEPTATAQPEPTSAPTSLATQQAGPPSAAEPVVFRIVAEESEARFLIDEILAGSPNVVEGVTTDVSGEITGSFESPQDVVVGPIQVDLSTLRTDNNFRNRAIHDAILQTGNDANRFAVFAPTSIEGLPEEVAFGTAYPLTLKGDLTIHGATRPVEFTATVTPVSEERLEGSASVSLPFSDFGIQILRLPPQVASVGEIVTLEINFVAAPD